MKVLQRGLALGLLVVACAACAQKEPETPALAGTCMECHRNEGAATVPGWPPLTSISSADLQAKLIGYRNQSNPGSRMTDVAHDLTDAEIRELAEYYGDE